MTGRPAHVLRESLPWRTNPPRTECGRTPRVGAVTITRGEWEAVRVEWNALVAGWRRLGASRPPGAQAPNVCQVCWATAERWPRWQDDPIEALVRELEPYRRWRPGRMAAREVAQQLWVLADLAAEDPTRFEDRVARRSPTPAALRIRQQTG